MGDRTANGAAPDDAAATYSPGSPPSKQFSGVRCIEMSVDGMLYVCDARNNRIQVFDYNGNHLATYWGEKDLA